MTNLKKHVGIWVAALNVLLGLCAAYPAQAGHWEFQYHRGDGKSSQYTNDSDYLSSNGAAGWPAAANGYELPKDQAVYVGGLTFIKGTPGSDKASSALSGSLTAYFKWSRDDDGDGHDDPGDHSKPSKRLVIREWWVVQAGGPPSTATIAQTPLGGRDIGMPRLHPTSTLTDTYAQSSLEGERLTTIKVPETTSGSVIVHAPTRKFYAKASVNNYRENWDPAEGIIHRNARASVGTAVVYGVEIYNLSLSAAPIGPYDTIKNTPDEKEFVAYAHWKARLRHDPEDANKRIVDPFMGGLANFGVTAQRANGDAIFPGQTYLWTSSTGIYVPVQPTVPSAAALWVRKLVQDDHAYHKRDIERYPYWPDTWITAALDPINMVPEWWGSFWDDLSLAGAAANAPDHYKLGPSTPNKTLHWNLGDDYDTPIPPTVVTASVTAPTSTAPSAPAGPVLRAGKVTINWVAPPQMYYEIAVLPLEWQVEEAGYWRTIGNVMISNEKLMAEMKKEALVAGGITIGLVGGGKLLKVVLAKPATAAFVARLVGGITERLAVQAALDGGIAAADVAAGKAKAVAQATELGRSGAVVETAQDTRLIGDGATAAEKTPVTNHFNPEPNTDPATLDPIPGDDPFLDPESGPPHALGADDVSFTPHTEMVPASELFYERVSWQANQVREGLPKEYRRFDTDGKLMKNADGSIKPPKRTIVPGEYQEFGGPVEDFGVSVSGTNPPKNYGTVDPQTLARPESFIDSDNIDPDVLNWASEVLAGRRGGALYPKTHDAEVRMIGKMVTRIKQATQQGKTMHGTLRIYIDDPWWEGPCDSCKNVLQKFQQIYGAQVKLEVTYGKGQIFTP